jgi:hypothetical protein
MARVARLTAIAAAMLVVASVGTASARTSGVGFTSVPQHAVQGNDARVAVSVHPSGVLCSLSVRYQGGTPQLGLNPVIATGGHASWTWRVPITVQAGPAKARVSCAGAGSSSRSLVIVGRLVEPKIVVAKQGFSIRPNSFGSGNRLSYGLILHNGAAQRDAMDVSVQTNFVMADDHLLGTDTQHISGIAAGSDYALGNSVSFPALAPIVRLEIVVQVASYAKATIHYPTLANIHILPQLFEPNWIGTVEGELQNTDPTMTLNSAQLSAVVFDSAGNIIGGGNGFAFQPLPPGARLFLQMSSGFDVIPFLSAASTMVSITPTWKRAGA